MPWELWIRLSLPLLVKTRNGAPAAMEYLLQSSVPPLSRIAE